MQNIENLNKVELEELLKNLRLYKDLVKKVGKRGKAIFKHLFNGTNTYTVEYYPSIDKDYILAQALDIYKKVFDKQVSEKDIKLIENDKIKGGMKIYLNDNLIDLSFLKFYNLLKK